MWPATGHSNVEASFCGPEWRHLLLSRDGGLCHGPDVRTARGGRGFVACSGALKEPNDGTIEPLAPPKTFSDQTLERSMHPARGQNVGAVKTTNARCYPKCNQSRCVTAKLCRKDTPEALELQRFGARWLPEPLDT